MIKALKWLGEYAATTRCWIHAYVLMTNHVHLLISASDSDGAGALMKALGAGNRGQTTETGDRPRFRGSLFISSPSAGQPKCPVAHACHSPASRCMSSSAAITCQVCFFADQDYDLYLKWLGEYAATTRCWIHAYVPMTNHVHLLISASDSDGAGALMKALGQRYVQYVNRSYRRSGTLWEGRFRSCPTQEESYLLACMRYIELNPVRAGMVTHPGPYRWSSYRANAEGESSRLISAP